MITSPHGLATFLVNIAIVRRARDWCATELYATTPCARASSGLSYRSRHASMGRWGESTTPTAFAASTFACLRSRHADSHDSAGWAPSDPLGEQRANPT